MGGASSGVGAIRADPRGDDTDSVATSGDALPQRCQARRGRRRGKSVARPMSLGNPLGVIGERLRHGGVLGLQARALLPDGRVQEIADGPKPMSRPTNCGIAAGTGGRGGSARERPRQAAVPKLPSNSCIALRPRTSSGPGSSLFAMGAALRVAGELAPVANASVREVEPRWLRRHPARGQQRHLSARRSKLTRLFASRNTDFPVRSVRASAQWGRSGAAM